MPIIKAGDINLSYDTFGAGEPLLLIMGFGAPGIAWMPVLPMLSGFKCIYFDNRGTGNSDKPENPYTIAEMADDASNLLMALGNHLDALSGFSFLKAVDLHDIKEILAHTDLTQAEARPTTCNADRASVRLMTAWHRLGSHERACHSWGGHQP